MLSTLTIQNFALIDRLSIDFSAKLNILTGETGAGKSILIDALRFVLGDRMQASQVRDTAQPCTVEAVFDLIETQIKSHPLFTEYLTSEDSSLIIQRSYLSDGRNKIKINGFNITVAQLKELGDHLIDFHGAYDHQMLLNEESHLIMLDKLIEFGKLKLDYEKLYEAFAEVQRKLRELQSMAATRQRDLDLLTHQVKELEQVELSEQIYCQLEQDRNRLNNAERLYESTKDLLTILEDPEIGLEETIRKAFTPLRQLSQIDAHATTYFDQLVQIQDQQQQLVADLNDYAASLSFEPNEAKRINDLYDAYDDIKKKYGPSLEDAAHFYNQAKARLNLLADFEQNDAELRKQMQTISEQLSVVAKSITQRRQKAAQSLKKTIEKELKDLGMPHIQFEVRIQPTEIGPQGKDLVSFFISPNAGEDLKPLAQIVSSGEAARVMLALKKALVHADPVPVLIFDEIDAQIGGRLGTITGTKLKELAARRQVILITHLPQIASFAQTHFKVNKIVKNNRAQTSVTPLNNEERVQELAQMMSGQTVNEISLSHAKDMLAQAAKI